MIFDFYPLRFEFVARDVLTFPPGKAANVLRGAFGHTFRRMICAPECLSAAKCPDCPYARIFEPQALSAGPSGLRTWPRPFVFRSSHLDGLRVENGQTFWFDVNLFMTREPVIDHFQRTFAVLLEKAELTNTTKEKLSISLSYCGAPVQKLRVDFVTPTELKGSDGADFGALFSRARDRISTLRALYGAGPLEIDFRALGERASMVRIVRSELRQVDVNRRSSRTGQTHTLGGFVGWAEYEGELGEFVPYLEAARYTGVGRQCVWGKGELRLTYSS